MENYLGINNSSFYRCLLPSKRETEAGARPIRVSAGRPLLHRVLDDNNFRHNIIIIIIYYYYYSGTTFASFQAIRYGQAPVGELRFKSPEPYMAEAGASVDVSQVSEVMCPQYAYTDTGADKVGQEDCLVLNIYVPQEALSDGAGMRSVMVWIHGGGLTVGSNAMNTGDKYSPFPLLDRDVIVVAINYRLSYLGFMYMGTGDVPGNAGLRDQTLAMSWVQDNIGQFGGDSESVTVFGQSGGSWSVSYHLASPLSSGLFQRAILESGTTVSASSSPVSPERALRAKGIVAETVNCTEETDAAMLECLQSVDAHDLVNSLAFPTADAGYAAPVVDGGLGLPDPFLPDYTEQLFASGQFNKDIEVMIGKKISRIEVDLIYFSLL